jgi:DNA-binding response OmpR family regulator
LAGTRVLVVEDEYLIADDLSRALSEAGASIVGPVGTVEHADKAITAGQLDGAILDLNLRGDMAFSVAERLHAQSVPFVIVSGYGTNALPEQLRDWPSLEKPVSSAKVIDSLARELGR